MYGFVLIPARSVRYPTTQSQQSAFDGLAAQRHLHNCERGSANRFAAARVAPSTEH